MTLPSLRFFRSTSTSDHLPTIKGVSRGNVQWQRTVFKAPPLRVQPPIPSTKDFSEIFGCGDLAHR